MNTLKRKALATAVLGTLGVAGSAHAIFQDANNLGQALVYPYYTVNNDPNGNAFNTFISVVNTTTSTKVVKVRFREGKASREVLDFNLYLSPNDVWVGAVVPASADSGAAGHLIAPDNSCTNPPIPTGGVDFRNFDYKGDPLGVDTLDRTREGYAEIFEMGVVDPAHATGPDVISATTHASNGVPSCGATVTGNPAGGGGAPVQNSLTVPTGGLSGTGTLINVTSGRDTMYNANAFGSWYGLPITPPYQEINTDTPNFSTTAPPASVVADPTKNRVYFSVWSGTAQSGVTVTSGARAAASTMMHDNVINEYILDAATASDTDWVMTFPVKRHFVGGGGSATGAVAPFTTPLSSTGACETIDVTYFNREEASATPAGVDFSPSPPGAAANSLCYESTVLSIRNGSANAPTPGSKPTSLVLGSTNVTAVNVTSTFQNGWMRLHFSGANASTNGLVSEATSVTVTAGVAGAAAAQTYRGLPVVGFMIRTFANGTLTCGSASCQGNYGGSVSHAYTLSVLP